MLLSLEQTTELLRILESDDITTELEEFIAQYGYDEGDDDDLLFAWTEVTYIHRYARRPDHRYAVKPKEEK
jgi:hypothetical protein